MKVWRTPKYKQEKYRNKSEETTKNNNKIKTIKLIPEELEGIVNDMYEMFYGDEFLFAKSFPEYTRGAVKRCWKKNGIGIYEKSPFSKETGKTNSNYIAKTTIKYGRTGGGNRTNLYSRD